jgi:hypothetical protein
LELAPALRRRAEVRALLYAVATAQEALGSLTQEERDAGRAAYLAAVAAGRRRNAALEELLEGAEREGIALVLLKGACLAVTHYGDVGARPMVDVDLLCSPVELPVAAALLRRLGYVPLPRASLTPQPHDRAFGRDGLWLELHFALWHELGLPSSGQAVLARARRVSVGRALALAPSPVDHLLVVLVHAATHGFGAQPLWLVDALLLFWPLDTRQWAALWDSALEHRAVVATLSALEQVEAALPSAAPLLRRLPPPPWARERASARRAALRRLGPWLRTGDGRLGSTRSRVGRALLWEDRAALTRWTLTKVKTMLASLG